LAGEEFKENDAQRPDVAGAEVGVRPELLGRHVGCGAPDAEVATRFVIEGDGKAKVGDMGDILDVQNDVVRLQVPVSDDSLPVGVLDGIDDGQEDPHGFDG